MINLHLKSVALPLVACAEKSQCTVTELSEYLTTNKEAVQHYLHSYGAILFKGFDIESAQAFQELARIFCGNLGDYVGGNSPRTKVASHIFTSTEYPREARISMHNEASYLKRMPGTICFFCVKPATKGGQTPLADCRRVLDRIDFQLRSRFERNGVLYVNNMHNGAGFGRSWMDVFGTKDRHRVEVLLNEDGYKFEWRPGGGLRTFMRAPAILRHPMTQEEAWVNQAEQWHPSSLDNTFREQLLSFLREDELPHNAFLGDGTPLSERDLKNIREAMATEEKIFPWKQGEVLVCDNVLVMHGRQPYSGDRKILVAMG